MPSKQSTVMLCLVFLMALASLCHAHSNMRYPCVNQSPDDGCTSTKIDYDTKSPLGTIDSTPKSKSLCKHPEKQPQATRVLAGKNLATTYTIGAKHGGGHCQWAISYDHGETAVVIYTMIRQCLKDAQDLSTTHTISVPIPKDVPNGKATFMWIWNNAIGNREIYSNCAEIEIVGGSNAKTYSGVAPLVANYGPGSVRIEPFPEESQPDGSEAFNKRKNITITQR